MIDAYKYLRCDGCHTILGRNLTGRIEIICYRSRCKRNNVFDTDKSKHYSLQNEVIEKVYKSHKPQDLTTNE